MFLLVVLNVVTLFRSDIEWAKIYSLPQRKVNIQLANLLPYDGQTKVVYTPPPTQVLSRYVSYFYQLYRIRESLNFTNEEGEFIKLLADYKPAKDHVYLFVLNTETHEIVDFSNRLREYYPEKKLTNEILKKLTEK